MYNSPAAIITTKAKPSTLARVQENKKADKVGILIDSNSENADAKRSLLPGRNAKKRYEAGEWLTHGIV